MKPLKLTRSNRLTILVCSALIAGWSLAGCGNTDDVPGYDTGGASGSVGANAGRAGASLGRAGATSGRAGTSGESGEGGEGGEPEQSGGNSGAGTSTGGMSGGAGMGGSLAGGAGGAGAGGAGAGGAGAGGAGAGGAGAGGAGGTCGNGVKEAAEQCDDATAGATVSTSPLCSNTCTSVSTQACVDCENAGDCFESVNNCVGVSAPFSVVQQTQCFSVMTCIEKSNCLDGTGTLGQCYCGSLSTQACGAAPFTGAGSPDGACVAEIKAGFPSLNANSQILAGLTATDFPSGAAMQRLSCQKGANQTACLTTCGFSAGGPAFP